MRYNNQPPSIPTITITLLTTTATILSTIYITKSLSKYGLHGTIRLLWEGDHLTPECREAMDTLDDVEYETIPKLEKQLEKIEIAIEVARLNSVDGPTTNNKDSSSSLETTNQNKENDKTNHDDDKEEEEEEKQSAMKQILVQYPRIKTDLGGLSYNLDKAAAEIDSAKSGGVEEVKGRKKCLSNTIVGLMNRADVLIEVCGGSGESD